MDEKFKKLAKNTTLLLVDDERDSRDMLTEVLGIFFKEVDSAGDGFEALEKIKSKNYDILLTDITMPKMDGFELIEEVRKIKKDQKIIIESAQDTIHFLLQAIKLSVDGYLLKPIDKKQMINTFLKVFEIIEAERLKKEYQKSLEEEVKKKISQIKEMSYKDRITNLPNREALNEFLKSGQKSIIIVNIDNFESINLVYGYHVGDLVLKRFGEFLGNYGKVFYLGADYFALIFKEDKDKVKNKAKLISNDLKNFHIPYKDEKIDITATFAISDKKPLLKTAHIALKDIRRFGKNLIGEYGEDLPTEKLHKKIREYMPILKEAFKKSRIFPYFQPIVSNKTKEIIRYEALVRIMDENGKLYPAYEFIEVAEISGLVTDITKIMIDKSFYLIKNNDIKISINLSQQDLRDEYFWEYLFRKTEEYNIDPSKITFEILEGITAKDMGMFVDKLNIIKDYGFGIALDDFGAENSNFEKIHSMHVDMIKIDGKYVKDINTNQKSYEVVKSIVGFSHNIGAKVVAEFVSSKEVFNIVKEMGVDFSQGFYLGKPSKDFK